MPGKARTFADVLNHTCNIGRQGTSIDGLGQNVAPSAPTHTGLACRFEPRVSVGDSSERTEQSRMVVEDFNLMIPAGTAVLIGDTVSNIRLAKDDSVIENRVFQIQLISKAHGFDEGHHIECQLKGVSGDGT